MSRVRTLLTHHAIIPMVFALLIGISVVVLKGPWWVLAFAPLGIGAQFLNEYSLHRYVFHWPPPKRQWLFNLFYQAHYGHHDFPTNLRLFFAPWWITLPILAFNCAVTFGITTLLIPEHSLALTASIVLVGGVSTFIAYEWFHMTAHLTVPKTRLEQHVTRLHNQHHFRDFGRWFHVSPGGEIIDRVMGTAISRESLVKQQRIEFIRTLGMRPDDGRLIVARNHFAEKYNLNSDEIERAGRISANA